LVQGPEGGEKTNILSEIRQKPQVMLSEGQRPQQSEDYNPKNGQGNDEDQKARSGNTQVVNSFSVKWKQIQNSDLV
jgi:hypothetical protein